MEGQLHPRGEIVPFFVSFMMLHDVYKFLALALSNFLLLRCVSYVFPIFPMGNCYFPGMDTVHQVNSCICSPQQEDSVRVHVTLPPDCSFSKGRLFSILVYPLAQRCFMFCCDLLVVIKLSPERVQPQLYHVVHSSVKHCMLYMLAHLNPYVWL